MKLVCCDLCGRPMPRQKRSSKDGVIQLGVYNSDKVIRVKITMAFLGPRNWEAALCPKCVLLSLNEFVHRAGRRFFKRGLTRSLLVA